MDLFAAVQQFWSQGVITPKNTFKASTETIPKLNEGVQPTLHLKTQLFPLGLKVLHRKCQVGHCFPPFILASRVFGFNRMAGPEEQGPLRFGHLYRLDC